MAKPASTSPSATRPTEARHSASRTRITNNCASPVRDAVAALPTASRASAQAVRIPTSHRGQGRPPPCKSAPACAELPPADDARKCASVCATTHSKAHSPMLSSVACWLRCRKLPMAWPGLAVCTQGSSPGAAPKYCSRPMALASTAASNRPAPSQVAISERSIQPPRTVLTRPAERAFHTTATTQPHSPAAIKGQKLVEGGWV